MDFKPGWKPCSAADALDEVLHELSIFEKCVTKGRVLGARLSLRRWRLHSAVYYLQELTRQTVQASESSQPPPAPVPAPYRASVSVTALCLESPDQAAVMLEDIAKRLRAGQPIGERNAQGLGEFRFTTLFAHRAPNSPATSTSEP